MARFTLSAESCCTLIDAEMVRQIEDRIFKALFLVVEQTARSVKRVYTNCEYELRSAQQVHEDIAQEKWKDSYDARNG